MSRAGYVLVGGRSSRMGRDKAMLPLSGSPLASAVARSVSAAAGSAILVGDPSLYGSLGFEVIPDLFPGEGPLGGIVTALEHSVAEWNLITACDMPGLTAAFLHSLLREAERGSLDVLAPAGPSGKPEPVCAVYRGTAREKLAHAFHSGERRAGSVFNLLETGVVRFEQAEYFQNVNTPQEWETYAAGRP